LERATVVPALLAMEIAERSNGAKGWFHPIVPPMILLRIRNTGRRLTFWRRVRP